MKFFLFLATMGMSLSAFASGITFHGRIIKSSDDSPLLSPTAEFRIRIQSPGSESCLMWEETQTRDMSSSNGVFTLTVGQATAPNTTAILNSATAANFTLPQVFSNGINYTGLTCSIGTSYNALSLHGRVMQVSFRETAGVGVWEDLPETSVNYVPLAYRAVDSETLGGRSANEFLKIASYPSQTILSNVQVDSLLGLVNGTNTSYLRPADNFAGDVTGPSTATVVSRIRGTNVVATAPTLNQVLKFDGTNWVPSADDAGAAPGDASYAAKGVVQINTDQATSGLFIASGVLALPNVITAAGPIGGVSTIPVVTYDQKGRLTAVTTATVDDTTKLPLAGGTMTGPINMGTQNITNATSIAATNFSGRNLVLNDNDTNTVTVRTPADIAANYALTLPVDDGTVGQVLTTDGAGILSWSAASAGAVTSVSSTNAYLSVATATTTPALTLNVGTAANTVAAGDDSRIVNAVQAAAYAADLAPAALCTTAQTPYWNTVSDLWACQNISVNADALGLFANGGNTFAGAATLGTNDNFALSFETNNTARMTILNNGNVGIGDTNPGSPLRIVKSTATTSGVSEYGIDLYRTFSAADTGSKSGIMVNTEASNAAGNFPQISGVYSQISKANAGTVAYSNNYAAATLVGAGSINYLSGLRVADAGGAGTVSNQYGVYISELLKGSTSNYAIYTDGSTNSYFGGNVGIGTLSPATALDVNGAMTFRAVAEPAATAAQGKIYYDTVLNKFRVSQNGGAYTDLIGTGGLTGSGTAGRIPVFTGATAVGDSIIRESASKIGIGGAPVGANVLSVIGGDASINGHTVGLGSGQVASNVAVGNQALLNNTTGGDSVAIGPLALSSQTTGYANVAVGGGALGGITTQFENVGIGIAAGGSLSSGRNTAVGALSLANATSGGGNTSLGTRSLYDLTTGGGNTVLGDWSGATMTTGSNNVVIGRFVSSTTLTTGSDNILIGGSASVDTPAAGTSNFLNIGNTIFATSTNTGTVAAPAGSVGIGTTNPGAMLQVGTAGTSLGTMRLTGNTSGFVQIQPAAAAGSWTMTLPSTDGNSGEVLTTDGSGVLSWAAASGGVTGTGTTNFIPKWSSATGLTDSIIREVASQVSIGGAAVGTHTFSVVGGNANINGVSVGRTSVGSANTLLGDGALSSNTSDGNTAMGRHALASNLAGQYNTAVGYNSMESNLGNYNVAIGADTMAAGGSGSANTALGQFALTSVSSGGNNVGLGQNAGANITTGSDNIIIGQGASAASATGNFQLNIGNLIFGDMTAASRMVDVNGSVNVRGLASAPSLSALDNGKFYYDNTDDRLKVSLNGGAYVNLLTSMSGFNSNQAIVANGSGNATSFTCSVGQVLGFDASGFAVCTNVTGTGGFLNAGNSFAADATLGTNDNFGLNFETNNTARMTILNNGNVGIGTAAPTSLLNLNNNFDVTSNSTRLTINEQGTDQYSAGEIHFTRSSPADGRTAGSILFEDAAGIGAFYGTGGIEGYLNFSTDAPGAGPAQIERMRISADGNVGIGTTAPGAMLQLGTAGTSLGTMRLTGNTSGYVQIQPAAAAGSWTMTLPANDGDSGQALLTNGSGVTSWTTIPANGGTFLAGDGSSASPSISFLNGATSGFYNASGSIGIAVSGNPGGNFNDTEFSFYRPVTVTNGSVGEPSFGLGDNTSIGTGMYSAGINSIGFSTNSSERMRIDSSGNVGIGTTPTSKLHVVAGGATKSLYSTSNPHNVLSGTHYSNHFFTFMNHSANSTATLNGIYNHSDSDLNFNIGSSQGIYNSVHVGAGSAVIDNARATVNEVTMNAAGTMTNAVGTHTTINLTSAGSIGSAYGQYVDMNDTGAGSITNSYGTYIDALTGTNRWGIYQAGASDNNYFAGNVGIGATAPGAMLQLGTAGTSLGTMRMTGNTSGYVQIQPAAAAGTWTMTLPANDGDSGQVLTTDGAGILSWAASGGASTIDGLTDAVTSYVANNMYLGTGVGATTTTGVSNTGIGTLSLPSVTSASNTVAVGSESLFSLTTGNFNTAVGRESMYGTTTGDQNTAVGMYSLASNTTGGSNVAVGDAALSSGNANANTAVGSSALGGAITGNDNVAIGYRAGVKATGASYGNIFLGNMAGPDTNSTVTDSLWISNYEGSPLIYGDFFNRRVGIATSAPGAMFQLGTAGTSLGTMRMTGNTSGYVQIQPAAAAGSWTMTLPTTDGTAGQALTTDGAGVTTWTTVPANGGTFLAGDGTAAAPSHSFSNDTTSGFFSLGAGTIGIAVNGNPGGGFSDTSFDFYRRVGVLNGSESAPSFGLGDNSSSGTGMFSAATNAIGFSTNGTEKVRISTGGQLSIGNTSTAHALNVTGSAGLSTGTAWTNTSDRRLKDIHGDYEYGLNEILKLNTVRFTYKKNNALNLSSEVPMTGFIAQEVQKVIPDAVTVRDDGYLELNVDPIHWATVNAVQDLYGMCKADYDKIQAHTKEISSIKREIASLKDENQILKLENEKIKKDLELIKKKLGL